MLISNLLIQYDSYHCYVAHHIETKNMLNDKIGVIEKPFYMVFVVFDRNLCAMILT